MVKGKYSNFIYSNIRQSRGQIIAIALLFVILSALINTAFCLLFDYKSNFLNEKERLNGEDIDLIFTDITQKTTKTLLEDTLIQNSEIKECEVNECYSGKGTVTFHDNVICENLSFIRFENARNKSVGKYEILETNGGSGVYLSYLFKVDVGCAIGDFVTVQIGNNKTKLKIAGFYHNIDTGTINCSDIAILITDDCFDNISDLGVPSFRVSVQLNDQKRADVAESLVVRDVEEKLPTITLIASSSINKLSSSRYITATICEVIIIISAGLMIVVIFAVIGITLSNYVRNSIKSLGMLKAVGYTSNSLIFPIACEFSIISLTTSVVGVLGSYAVLPVINKAIERQTGVPYKIHFLPLEAIASIGICTLTAFVTSYLSAVKIRKILPINAIRENSNSGKNMNIFALDTTRFSLNTAISLKNCFSGWGRNIVLFISITGVSFLLGFAGASYQNIIQNNKEVLNLVCGQMTDSVISVPIAFEDALTNELSENSDVERYYMFTVNAVTPDDLPKMYAYVIDSTENVDEKNVCVEGNLPLNENEIAVNGMYAKISDLKIGDKLTFSASDKKAEFIVSGITQGAYSSGRDGFLTREGYKKFGKLNEVRYYVDLKGGVSVDNFNNLIAEKCKVLFCTDFQKSVETVSRSYMNILKIATSVMVALSFLIAAFVLYILISVLLSKKRKEHGILISLGFVSGNIIYQTVVSYLPTVVISCILGLCISRRGAADILTLALNCIGVFSFGSPTKALLLAGIALLEIFFIIVFSVLISLSVKKIDPHKLFTNE